MESSTYEQDLAFLRANLPSWKDLPSEAITFDRLNGLSNAVYKVSTTQSETQPNPVILRQFGKHGLIDRSKERYIFELLGEKGLGPKSYGANEDYRLEEYIPSRNLKHTELNEKSIRRKLARAVARLHRVDFPKLDKTGFFVNLLDDQAFYDKFNSKCSEDTFTPEELKFIEKAKVLASREEREFLKSCLPKEEAVFCHNDILPNNILIADKTSDVCIIDVEYGNYNFRGFDIGNLLAEWTFDCTLPEPPYYVVNENNYPSNEDIVDFIRYYVLFNRLDKEESGDDLIEDEKKFAEYEAKLSESNPEEYSSFKDSLFKQVKVGTMLSFYFWSTWALMITKIPNFDFDYIKLSKDKYDGYIRFKEAILSQDKL